MRGRSADERITEIEEYIETSWMDNSKWDIKEWCVFGYAVRTNNDVEGWHRRLNGQAHRGKVPFYLLVKLLHNESRLVSLQAQHVSESRLKRYQRKTYVNIHKKLFKLWGEYSDTDKEMSTSSLLRACSGIYNPTPASSQPPQ